jgi:hypothetical protein
MAPQGLVTHILLKAGELCFQFSGVASYKIFFSEMDIKISKQWNQWNSEKLCVVFYWLLVDMYCPWSLAGSRSPCGAVECSFSVGCSVCCCCSLSHTGLSVCLEQREPSLFLLHKILSFYTGSCLHLVPLLLQWMRR